MNSKIASLIMFYRNDQPGGIGLHLRDVSEEHLRNIREGADELYKEAAIKGETDFFLRAAMEELEEIGRKVDFSADWPVIYSAIHILITHKVVPDDEYNGFIFIRSPEVATSNAGANKHDESSGIMDGAHTSGVLNPFGARGTGKSGSSGRS